MDGLFDDKPVQVTQVSSSQDSQLTVQFLKGNKPKKVTGTDLERLVLRFWLGENSPQQSALSHELRIRVSHVNGRDEYRVIHRRPDQTVWSHHCLNPPAEPPPRPTPPVDLRVSFLPGWSIDAKMAFVSADDSVVTMACRKGAIATCLDWKYAPWKQGASASGATAAEAFGACLQAKRAAFCIGSGDPRSFTKNGTPIVVGDREKQAASQNLGDPAFLEALWNPHGATCLNASNRRRKDDADVPAPDCALPQCTSPQSEWFMKASLSTSVLPQ
ncbi:hypothetical protein D187_009708 [Cystobacter fuscus DSM 2262]|uniref:ADYC domain-containing protein n=1 Tax=Cystobacter fuscus (strain ATCC 25194 / DSM 2262 / NBRC 100088 / M29) TaxID=1242864 RepID=S9Q134_CYSF2|nr:ADYC domain-containing protein [Cystobacter fuscus]EPX54969.1 hypothetical protein D187_009708 [Cystobacter fuscus DSM 2262]